MPRQPIEIEISSRKDRAHPRPLAQGDFALERSGENHCTAGLDDHFERLPGQPHRRHDALFGNRHDVIDLLGDDSEVDVSKRRSQSVRDGARVGLRDKTPAAQRALRVVGSRRLAADDLDGGLERSRHDSGSRQQATSTHRCKNDVQARAVLEKFQRASALAGDGSHIVIGMDMGTSRVYALANRVLYIA